MKGIKTSLSVKITAALFAVILLATAAACMGVSFYVRDKVLREYKKRSMELASMAADYARREFEGAIDRREHGLEEFLSFQYREMSLEECSQKWVRVEERGKYDREYLRKIFHGEVKKPNGEIDSFRRYMTSYSADRNLVDRIKNMSDGFLKIPEMGFCGIIDKNGYGPFHHEKNSRSITGDIKADMDQCRTNRIWAHLGKRIDPRQVSVTSYKRDTGAVFLMAHAPIWIKGQFWGGAIIGYNAADLNQQVYSTILLLVVVILAGALLVSLVIHILIKKNLCPIFGISLVMNKLSAGDFSELVEVRSEDEIGVISRGINRMIRQVSRAIGYIHNLVASLSASSEELASASANIGDSMVRQGEKIGRIREDIGNILGSLTETHSYIEGQIDNIRLQMEIINKLDGISGDISENIKKVKDVSDVSMHLATMVREQVDQATGKMGTIVKASGTISDIVTAIDTISDKIHMLSLNANIEAARAGSYGKGFAVIASEIGKLADNSSSLVKEVHARAQDIENSIVEGSMVVEAIRGNNIALIDHVTSNSGVIDATYHLTDEQTVLYEMLKDRLQENVMSSRSINDVLAFQQKSSESIEGALGELMDLSSETSSGAEELAGSSEELAAKAAELNALFAGYKLQREEQRQLGSIGESPETSLMTQYSY